MDPEEDMGLLIIEENAILFSIQKVATTHLTCGLRVTVEEIQEFEISPVAYSAWLKFVPSNSFMLTITMR